jgi:hypothetical protein
MTLLESVLGVALILSLIGLTIVIRYAQSEHRLRLKRASDAFRMGASQKIGDLSQLLGTFHVLTEYDEISTLSSTSAQSSMDLLGRKGNQLDFIEFKKTGTSLTKSERALRTSIETGQLKIAYRIIDVAWPDGIRVQDRV